MPFPVVVLDGHPLGGGGSGGRVMNMARGVVSPWWESTSVDGAAVMILAVVFVPCWAIAGRSIEPTNAGATPTVLFADGNKDDHNRTWPCVRGPAIVRTPNGSLLALAGVCVVCGRRRNAQTPCARNHYPRSGWIG